MKPQGEPETRNVRNAWGGYRDMTYQHYVVEQADVGTTQPHYGGYQHERYTFRPTDVGRVISRISSPIDPSYGCWTFVS